MILDQLGSAKYFSVWSSWSVHWYREPIQPDLHEALSPLDRDHLYFTTCIHVSGNHESLGGHQLEILPTISFLFNLNVISESTSVIGFSFCRLDFQLHLTKTLPALNCERVFSTGPSWLGETTRLWKTQRKLLNRTKDQLTEWKNSEQKSQRNLTPKTRNYYSTNFTTDSSFSPTQCIRCKWRQSQSHSSDFDQINWILG